MSTTQIATWSSFTVFTCQTRRWKVCDAIDIRAPHGPGSPRASRPSGSLGGWSDIFRHRVHAPHRAHGWSGEHYYPFGCRRSHIRSEEHTSELQSHHELVCRLLLGQKKNEFYLPARLPSNQRATRWS